MPVPSPHKAKTYTYTHAHTHAHTHMCKQTHTHRYTHGSLPNNEYATIQGEAVLVFHKDRRMYKISKETLQINKKQQTPGITLFLIQQILPAIYPWMQISSLMGQSSK